MIATRRRNYDEARDAYLVAMHELSAINNEVEYAKTALKYATMVYRRQPTATATATNCATASTV